MTITPEQRETLKKASKPLIKWLNENCHPHCQVIVDPSSAELLESTARVVTTEFTKD